MRTTAERRYQAMTTRGPDHPIISANFFENRTISRKGLEKLEYIVESELAHF